MHSPLSVLGFAAGFMFLAGINTVIAADVAGVNASPTFTEDVAPIIFNHCSSCHRPGEAAPFPLLDFEQVKRKARTIVKATASRVMPPWKVEGDFVFHGDRRLTDEQIGLIDRWVKGGMLEGPKEKLPALPKFTEGWQLGPPDLVVSMAKAYPVPAEGPDIYRNFVIPLKLDEDKWVQTIDFRPGARSVVHHSLFFYDTDGLARKRDGEDGQPGFGQGMGGARNFSGLGGWALGGNARALPDGLANKLPKGADIVLSTHFHLSGKAEAEASVLGLYFSKEPPRESYASLQLPPRFGAFSGIDIPAGNSNYVITDSFVLPVAASAFGVSAHAHYLGKDFKLTATFPDGAIKTLAWIKDWDFSWQEQYLFEQRVDLPAGTILKAALSYDNSAENPRNPSRPPKRVRWGEQSTDEMGSMTLMVVAKAKSEFSTLAQGYRDHIREVTTQGLRALAGTSDGFVDQLIERYDENHDGKLSSREVPPRLAAVFDRVDVNHDGFLDREELKPIAARFAGALPAVPAPSAK